MKRRVEEMGPAQATAMMMIAAMSIRAVLPDDAKWVVMVIDQDEQQPYLTSNLLPEETPSMLRKAADNIDDADEVMVAVIK